jgi:hypothetical protein
LIFFVASKDGEFVDAFGIDMMIRMIKYGINPAHRISFGFIESKLISVMGDVYEQVACGRRVQKKDTIFF